MCVCWRVCVRARACLPRACPSLRQCGAEPAHTYAHALWTPWQDPWCTPCLEHGEVSLSCGDRDHVVSLQWSEKFWLLVDHLQIFAALWVAECAAASKRFPQSWCSGSQMAVYGNWDVGAMRAYSRKALNSTAPVLPDADSERPWEENNYALLILVPPAVFVVLMVELFLLREQLLLATGGGGGRGLSKYVPALERAVLRALQLVFLPWAMFVFRHVLCVEMHAISRWQLELTCKSGKMDASQLLCRMRQGCAPSDVTVGVCLLVAIGCFALGLPGALVLLTRRTCIFGSSRKHAFWLSAVETEFVVGLSSAWSLEHYSLSSSFTRPWHHGLALVLFFKLEMEMHMQKHL